jgi:hypothetical protein
MFSGKFTLPLLCSPVALRNHSNKEFQHTHNQSCTTTFPKAGAHASSSSVRTRENFPESEEKGLEAVYSCASSQF